MTAPATAGGGTPSRDQARPAPTPGATPTPGIDPARSARRLLRWYPASWRARYGEEFTELLIADLAERPRDWRRTADVARSGLLARFSAAGLTAHPLDPARAARAGLATLACACAVFLTFAAAMWAQLTIGWQWAPPATRATSVAMIVMSGAMLLLAALAALAAIPAGWAAIRASRRGQGRVLRGPALLTCVGMAVLVAGGRHFGNGWPGTGGHPWPHPGLVPGGVAAFSWASTLSVTSYWAHPAALAAFPAAELAWMVVSPVAMCCLVTGTAQLVRRIELSGRAIRFESWVGSAASLSMAAFLAGALCWLTEGGPGPRGLFHAGVIDAAGLGVMALALVTGWRVLHLARNPALAGTGSPMGSRPPGTAARR
ncbi:MAG TPA: hypothetical protein VIX86_13975 [Streptosporangiaceae bacterium]